MSTRIRLRKVGRKKVPLYRIVVADKESPRDGRFVAILGTYDPKQEGAKKVVVDVEQAKSWLAKGAVPTGTVQALLKTAGVIPPASPA
jgi:small subunit ribosomal protein S16